MAETITENIGLSPTVPDTTIRLPDATEEVIDLLRPKSDLHKFVLNLLLRKIETSEKAMSQFEARWNANEKRIQAYIDLPQFEKELQEQNDSGKPPAITSIVVPYSFATISTIVTFLMQSFLATDPLFQIGAYNKESIEPARRLETFLKYNADHVRYVKWLFQFLQDTQVYGVGIFRNQWVTEFGMRTVFKPKNTIDALTGKNQQTEERVREKKLIYQGNDLESQDPFLFFPDPTVPMHEVNSRGEYVNFRMYRGRHLLLRGADDGLYKYIDAISKSLPRNKSSSSTSSQSLRATGGVSMVDNETINRENLANLVQIDEISIDLIPSEFRIGSSNIPEKWLFTIANKEQIIRAELNELDHGMHPCAVAEPYTMGYSFGQLGIADYLNPLQDSITWLINSHMDNVRRVLNDVIVVDPSAIEMDDLTDPSPGKIIRLKRSLFGRDVRTVIHQLNVHDVTQGHVADSELMFLIGQRISAVTDTLTGAQPTTGRETATSVRTRGQSAVSRLVNQSRLISAQAITDLTQQQVLNTMQFLDGEFSIRVLGPEGAQDLIEHKINPQNINGDYFFPVHDGTIPIDRAGEFESWKEVFLQASQNPAIMAKYDIGAIFEHVAQLGGAKDISRFRIQQDDELDRQVQSGNTITLQQAQQAFGG